MENQPASAAQPPAMNPVRANRRLHPRYACEGRAEVFVPHGALLFQGKILDLSMSGCLIETPALNLERGTHVEVYVAALQMQFRVSGHIAVLYPRRGAGIAFQRLGARRARYVADLIRELAEAAPISENHLPNDLPV